MTEPTAAPPALAHMKMSVPVLFKTLFVKAMVYLDVMGMVDEVG
jgi:hypothetical protein